MLSEHKSGWIEQTPTRRTWRSVGRVVVRGGSRVRRDPADDEEHAPPEEKPEAPPKPSSFRDRVIEKRER